MDNGKKQLGFKKIALFLIIPSLLLAPFVVKPYLLMSQNNDLNAFSYPLFELFRNSFINYQFIPYWQNKFLTGYPLLGDPQSIIMYPFNYISLITNLSFFFLIYFFFHIILSSVGVFLLGREFGLSQKSSLLAGLLYSIAPKMAAHMEAGHTNLYASYAYIPFAILLYYKILKKPSVKISILLAFFLSLIYILYITTFYYLLILFIFYFFWHFIIFKAGFVKKLRYIILSAVFFIGFSLPELLASYELFPQLTRGMLTYEDVAGPVFAWRQFAHFLFNPALTLIAQTETVLYLGAICSILAFWGFLNLSRKIKIATILLLSICLLYAFGPKTPFYYFLYRYFPGVALFRVPTRMWFIVTLTFSVLFGLGIDKLYQSKKIKLALFFAVIAVMEFLYLGMLKIYPENIISESPVPKDLYINYFSNEKDFFRVYCTVNCLSYYDSLNFNLGFTTGYNPIQLADYFWFIQEAGGYKFGSYTLSIPPYQTFVDKPQPKPEMLGILGVRYAISPYPLTDRNFKLENSQGGFYLYRNLLEKPRAYLLGQNNKIIPLTVIKDIPGYIEISDIKYTGNLIVQEMYVKGWKVYKDGIKEDAVRSENVILSTSISELSKSVSFSYEPLGTPWSWYILIATYGLSALLLVNKRIS